MTATFSACLTKTLQAFRSGTLTMAYCYISFHTHQAIAKQHECNTGQDCYSKYSVCYTMLDEVG